MNELNKTLAYLQENHCLEQATIYGEPGYENPKNGILFANWNEVPKDMSECLEKSGYDLEWSDEWLVVDDKAYRIESDSYFWESRVLVTQDGGILTPDDLPFWVTECRVDSLGQDYQCLPSWFPDDIIEKEGYELMDTELESGLFPGMDDKPETYIKKYLDEGADAVLFQRKEKSQFYSKYLCWVKMPSTDDSEEA